MKVIHLISSVEIYGAEKVLMNLLPALSRKDINVSLGCISPSDHPLGKQLQENNVNVFFIHEKEKVSLGGLFNIYKAVRASGADIIHTHVYKANILGGIISLIVRKPLVITYHAESKYLSAPSFYFKVERYFLEIAKHIIAVSENIKKELMGKGISEKKISVIPNGIDDPDEYPTCGRITNSADSQKNNGMKILCIGRLIKIKRYDLVLKAVASLKVRFPGIKLMIAGNGPLEADLKNLAEMLNILEHVEFLGYIEKPSRLYREADILVISSDTEGSPMVLLEAMAFSLPIVATAVGAIPEIVENNKQAMIIPPNDLQAMIDAISLLINNEETRRRISSEARNLFLKKYSSDNIAGEYNKIYEKVVSIQTGD